MPSFQTILFAATAALAGFASAAPAYGSDSSLVARCECDTVPAILANVQTQIAIVNVDLKAKITAAAQVDAKVDIAVVTPAIAQIKAIVDTAVVQVKAIAHLDLNVILASNGTVLSVQACAQVVAQVIAAICAVLHLAVTAVVTLQVKACLDLIVQVGLSITALLQTLFSLVVGLQAAVCVLVKLNLNLLAIIKACGLLNVLALIHIQL